MKRSQRISEVTAALLGFQPGDIVFIEDGASNELLGVDRAFAIIVPEGPWESRFDYGIRALGDHPQLASLPVFGGGHGWGVYKHKIRLATEEEIAGLRSQGLIP